MNPRLRLYTKPSYYFDVLKYRFFPGSFDKRLTHLITDQISAYTGINHIIPVSMGRMAIYEGLKALPREQGKEEIILSPITVPEVISMVLLAKYKPVFCDIEPTTWNLNPDLAAQKINSKTAAIMTTHFYGYANTTGTVRELCDKHNLFMIEDSAQALGSFPGKVHAGNLSDFTIFSFSYPKNVTSFYGGALATNNADLANTVLKNISTYPKKFDRRWYYDRVKDCFIKDCGTSPLLFPIAFSLIKYGYKKNISPIKNLVEQHLSEKQLSSIPNEYVYQFTNLQAEMIRKKLPEIDADIGQRIKYASIYHEGLKDIQSITIAPLRTDTTHTYLYYPIKVKDKYNLMKYLIINGCDVAMQHAPDCSTLSAYQDFHANCPNATNAANGTLMLPTYPSFGTKNAHNIVALIKQYLPNDFS